MKRILLLSIIISLAVSLSAQTPHRNGRQREKKEKIENIITDLTPQQKSQIDAITQRSSKNIERYRTQLDAVRDSLRLFMNSRDDNSKIVFRLYDREARLQAELSKEYYRTKVAIDAILTQEQYSRMQERMEARHKKASSNPSRPKPQTKGGK